MVRWTTQGDVVPDLAAVWRAAAEVGPAMIAVTPADPDGVRIGWANDAAYRLLEADAEALLGCALAELVPRAARQEWSSSVLALIGAGGGCASARLARPDGIETSIFLTVTPLDARPQHSAGWLVQLHPTTDEMAAALRSSHEAEFRFSTLAEHAPIGIFMSEAGMRLGYVNHTFARFAGVEPERLQGMGWLDHVHRQDVSRVYSAVQLVLAGEPQEVSVRLHPVGDTQRWVLLRMAPVTTPARAAGYIGTVEDVTARRAWEEQLAYQATHDPLTGLANRRHLLDVLRQLLYSRRANDRELAVLFCDLDGFKAVNDRWGHDMGDRVLMHVAGVLQRTARDHDLVARVAGDEFVVVLRRLDGVAGAEAAARRHVDALSQPFVVDGETIKISACIGIALPRPNQAPEALLRAADRVMYQAKAQGSGHLVVEPQPDPETDPEMDPEAGTETGRGSGSRPAPAPGEFPQPEPAGAPVTDVEARP